MKIWKMNDSDWVAAVGLESAKKALADLLCDGKIEDVGEYLDEPRELTEAEYDQLKFSDFEPGDDEYGQPGATRTFREQLNRMIEAGEEFPCSFASSDL